MWLTVSVIQLQPTWQVARALVRWMPAALVLTGTTSTVAAGFRVRGQERKTLVHLQESTTTTSSLVLVSDVGRWLVTSRCWPAVVRRSWWHKYKKCSFVKAYVRRRVLSSVVVKQVTNLHSIAQETNTTKIRHKPFTPNSPSEWTFLTLQLHKDIRAYFSEPFSNWWTWFITRKIDMFPFHQWLSG